MVRKFLPLAELPKSIPVCCGLSTAPHVILQEIAGILSFRAIHGFRLPVAIVFRPDVCDEKQFQSLPMDRVRRLIPLSTMELNKHGRQIRGFWENKSCDKNLFGNMAATATIFVCGQRKCWGMLNAFAGLGSLGGVSYVHRLKIGCQAVDL